MTPLVSGPPKRLGKYEVGAKIGGGGMATVYIGRAPGPVEGGPEELVALKVIRDELASDEQFAHMFIDEAKILAQLSHPNVIQTLEYGVTGRHRFIAMELLSGRTYADVWDLLVEKGESMPVKLGAWVCARVAEGLHSAHELVDETGSPLAVIHRDVNPTNIFLTHNGEVKLIDFGLAKARVRVSRSADGIVKGKIPYLAPEQAQGKPIDRRIDIYALGTTLWETSTMKRLFKRDTDVDTLLAIRAAKVPPIRDIVPDFPDALWEIIAKALQVSADDRFQTAYEMKDALDAFVGDDGPGMQHALVALLTNMFPGQEARQAKWMRDATALRMPSETLPPPAPVPIASSTLLEDDRGSKPGDSKPTMADTVETDEEIAGTIPKSRRPRASIPPTPAASPTPPPTTTSTTDLRDESKSDLSEGKKRKKRARTSTGKAARQGSSPDGAIVVATEEARRAADDARRRFWIGVGLVVAIAAAIIWIFAR